MLRADRLADPTTLLGAERWNGPHRAIREHFAAQTPFFGMSRPIRPAIHAGLHLEAACEMVEDEPVHVGRAELHVAAGRARLKYALS
jgi:hypothetical protein